MRIDTDTELKNRYRRNNYRQTQGYDPREWTEAEIKLVLAHAVSDRELSKILHRSVQAIQLARCRAKKSESADSHDDKWFG